MPCHDGGGPTYGMSYDEQRRLKIVEATLCGLLRVLSPSPEHARAVFQTVDWKEAGITLDEAYKWWMDHVAKDKARQG